MTIRFMLNLCLKSLSQYKILVIRMGRWDSDDEDWRGWKDGRYDNRYAGTNRHRKYRDPYKKRQTKKIGIGITLVAIIGVFGFLFVNGIFEFNPYNLEKSLQNIPEDISDTAKTAKDIATETSDKLQETVTEQIESIQEPTSTTPQKVTPEYHTTMYVIENRPVTLLSNEKHNLSSTYLWKQLEGEPVKLSSYSAAEPTFMAPEIPDGETKSIVFRLTVNDPKIGEFIDVITIIVNPVAEPLQIVTKKSPDELVQYALEQINEDRTKNNLAPVLLSYNSAAQIHAEDVLEQRKISHWMSNGEKPYMTYSRLGGTGDVSQNVGFSGFVNPEECTNYNVICEKIDPFNSIKQSEYSMMYDDASSDWGHRDNILRPYHTHVSLGIAYDDYTFVFVQNFEDNYLVSDTPISVTGNHVTINSELKSGSIQNIGIFYDSLPTHELYLQHYNDGYYEMGDTITVVVPPPPPNSYYDQPTEYTLIEADRWNTGSSVLIDFDLSSVLTRPGVYTVGVWVDEGGESFLVTSYSIFYKG
ncbi:MAG: CAP domain-containing protein [Nitrosarchaeum sp.]|nr:MAG: CAP domain-containing protein [Nitrosarchaeum sp.]